MQVSPGSDCMFVQEVAAINTREKHCCTLGEISKHAAVTPDVDYLLDPVYRMEEWAHICMGCSFRRWILFDVNLLAFPGWGMHQFCFPLICQSSVFEEIHRTKLELMSETLDLKWEKRNRVVVLIAKMSSWSDLCPVLISRSSFPHKLKVCWHM